MQFERLRTSSFEVLLLWLSCGKQLASTATNKQTSLLGPSALKGFDWLDRVSLILSGAIRCHGGKDDRVVAAGNMMVRLHQGRPVIWSRAGDTMMEALEDSIYCCMAPLSRPQDWRWEPALQVMDTRGDGDASLPRSLMELGWRLGSCLARGECAFPGGTVRVEELMLEHSSATRRPGQAVMLTFTLTPHSSEPAHRESSSSALGLLAWPPSP